jgi:hypothetical protein
MCGNARFGSVQTRFTFIKVAFWRPDYVNKLIKDFELLSLLSFDLPFVGKTNGVINGRKRS